VVQSFQPAAPETGWDHTFPPSANRATVLQLRPEAAESGDKSGLIAGALLASYATPHPNMARVARLSPVTTRLRLS
jgi:hypothetical protein